MKDDIKVLILEDNTADADLIIRHLTKSGMSFVSKIVESKKLFWPTSMAPTLVANSKSQKVPNKYFGNEVINNIISQLFNKAKTLLNKSWFEIGKNCKRKLHLPIIY